MVPDLIFPLPAGEREGPQPQAWEGEGTRLSRASPKIHVPSPSHRFAAGPSLSPAGRGTF
jgi:hypothetical protein